MIEHALSPLILKNKTLLPIVQGGMGIGVSAHRLAGTVAGLGGVGTIASVDLRHLHPDLVEESLKFTDEAEYDRLNLIALDREVKAALKLANGNGMVSVNVMKAVASHADYVRQACESGAQVVTMGAGLPLDLPEMVANFPDVALLPILSEARGIAIVIKRWMKKNRLPDAIVIEHPKYAGGHLGAAKKEDINDDRFNFDRVLEETFALFKTLDLEREQIPLIVAGGVNSHEKVKTYLGWGAAAVQVGTPFAVCQEGDAAPEFKKVLAEAKSEDIVEFMSVAGLPARGVLTPFLKSYLRRETILQANAKPDPRRCTQALNCLAVCGLRDGLPKVGQFCIDLNLAAAYRGDLRKGLFFRGSESVPFGAEIRSAREVVEYLLTGVKPADLQTV